MRTITNSTRTQDIVKVMLVAAFMLLLSVTAIKVSAQTLSPAEAAAQASAQTGGKVLKVKTSPNNVTDYQVKMLLPSGTVRHVTVDGNSGKLKKSK